MNEYVLLMMVFGVIVSFPNWRLGMLVCILTGFLADPARKLMTDQPVYMAVIVGVIFATVILSFIFRNGLIDLGKIHFWRNALSKPFHIFLLWLLYEAIVSLLNYQNPMIAAIGMLSYLGPFPAFIIGYYYGLRAQDMQRFMKIYISVAVLMVSGIYLSYYGVDWAVLKEISRGVPMYSPYTISGYLNAYPGFYRSTEGAAWHINTTVCFIIILAVSRKLSWPKLVVAAVIILLVGAGMMTGRRKLLVEILNFVCLYTAILFYFRHGAGRLAGISLLIVALVAGGITFGGYGNLSDIDEQYRPYIYRGMTVFGEIDERFHLSGVRMVEWALDRYGLLGGGLGVASQGTQHFGGGASVFGGSGEGGLGKIVAELGVPGLLIIIWMMGSIFSYSWKMMKIVSKYKSPLTPLFYGLFSFLCVNILSFIIATQIYGDMFVLLILGWVVGFFAALAQVIITTGKVHAETVKKGAIHVNKSVLHMI